MIKLINQTSSEVVDVYDVRSLIQMYSELGIHDTDMDSWNTYVHAIFPEGGHGKFIIAADKAALLNTGSYEITLEIQDINAGVGLSIKKLIVRSVRYLEVPMIPWTLANPSNINEESRKVAIVELEDYSSSMDDIVNKDYNRITKLAPVDTANKFEPVVADLKDFNTIIGEILTDNPVGGATLAFSITGLPTDFKPRNVLSAGSCIKDVFQLVANAHFLVVFIDRNGVVTITNEQTTGQLVPLRNSLIYSEYGPPTCPDKVFLVFSENAHQQSKQRTTLLIDYTGNTNLNWATDFIEPDNTTDPTLPNVSRTASSGNSEAIYYPYLEHDEYNELNTDSEYVNLLDALQTNYEARTQRVLKVAYKGLHIVNPSATVNRVSYRYLSNQFITTVESLPPEKLAVPALTNQIARGLEYVPPFLRGTVTIGGDAPVSEDDVVKCELQLPLRTSYSSRFKVPFYNESGSGVSVGTMVGVHYNIHTRRYELIDGSGGGGGDSIRFVIVSVECSDKTCVWVRWTHYTGGCGSVPPGVDPYTGYIKVIDSCILSYYTIDFLEGSGPYGTGASGRATYWYPREEYNSGCEGVWIIDSICGQPECA